MFGLAVKSTPEHVISSLTQTALLILTIPIGWVRSVFAQMLRAVRMKRVPACLLVTGLVARIPIPARCILPDKSDKANPAWITSGPVTSSGAIYNYGGDSIDFTKAGISFDDQNDWMTYGLTAYDTNFNMIQSQCTGDCPNSAALVSATVVQEPLTPTQKAQKFKEKYKAILDTFRLISGLTGRDPAFCGWKPLEGESEASAHPKKQSQADENFYNGKAVKDSKPKRPGPSPKYNPNGSTRAEAGGALAEAADLVHNGGQCIANSQASQH